MEADRVFDLSLYGMLSAIVGARIFYIIFYDLSYYLHNPARILSINEGGLSVHGGLIGAFIFAFLYFRKHKLSFFPYADAIAPGIILGQGIGRVGCDVFGKVMSTTFPWGIERQGQLLHPTQVYEFLLDYIVFYVLWRKRKNIKYNGQLFVWYLILFALNRSIVELFRYNPSIIGSFSISHLLSLGLVMLAVVIRFYLKKKGTHIISDTSKDTAADSISRTKELIVVFALITISIIIFYTVQA